MNHVLFIGTVWPEPNSSAAGSRTLQLIELFQSHAWKVSFSCSAAKSEFSFNLSELNVDEYSIKLNHNSFDAFISELKPTVVVFDRFMTEEQYGWRVAESSPDTIRLLDTIDLHCLRLTRQQAFKEKRPFNLTDLLKTDIAKRELASIYRCDCSLMISETEMDILQNIFGLSSSLLHYIPFLLDTLPVNYLQQFPSFEERQHFVTIGNFLHEPNWNSVLYLKENIWPLIKQQLKEAELHVYGAYVSPKVLQLHNEQEGFLIKGRADRVESVMKSARVCLAPLRFGAGLKGKLLDAMLYGTPSVTTSIGSEGMHGVLEWNGFISDNPKEFSCNAVELYTHQSIWLKAQQQGVEIVNQIFNKKLYTDTTIQKLTELQNQLSQHRSHNFIGSMLLHHTISSTKYMSRWIEAKNQ